MYGIAKGWIGIAVDLALATSSGNRDGSCGNTQVTSAISNGVVGSVKATSTSCAASNNAAVISIGIGGGRYATTTAVSQSNSANRITACYRTASDTI